MKTFKTICSAAVIATIGFAGAAEAGPQWQANHPRRAQDNARLRNQNARITQGVRDGQLTRAEAHTLRSNDRAIRAEERADASVNGSHLTRADQRQINAHENANSRDIHAARH